MKKILFFSAAALALASCSNDEFLGEGTGQGPSSTSSVIGFGSEALNATRANFAGSQAAEKLNGNFIVYGFKTASDEVTSGGDQKVFDLYNVNYAEGTANTTESNTAGWEYVGLDSHTGSSNIGAQTIKYWDLSANSYVFSAVSGLDITAAKILAGSVANNYEKGWNVTIPAGGSLSDLYASNRVVMTKSGSVTSTSGATSGKFMDQVNLTFYNLATKIRFGIYETIPGYSVKIDKFYYASSSSETNFGVDGSFKTLPAEGTTLKVTYYDNTTNVENRPKVEANSVTAATSGEFGTNIQAQDKIGTNSIQSTYDQAEGVYTYILPYNNTSGMELKVDYTLTSTDDSGETIKVTGATAKVPANFTNWKENFAYTYLFKISDNTNGSTDGGTTAGLYPITFDAVVVDAEDGIQETITSVADPSITTYQKGVVVTANDEYVAGEIYFENDTKNISTYHVYEVNNYGTEATTEEVVANWKNNFCVLTEITTTDASTLSPAGIPLSDGTYISKTANQAAMFTAVAGKTYVIVSGEAKDLDPTASKAQCKVVKVSGNLATDPTYTQSMTTATISAANGVAVYKLKSDSPKANSAVIGAAPLLKIYDSSDNDVTTNFTIAPGSADGNYKIGLTPAAIAAGANDTYTVKFNGEGDKTFEVNLGYSLSSSPVTVVTAGTTATFTLNDGTNAISNAVIKNLPAGVTITETSTAGTYKVAASADATPGSYTTVTVAGQALTINVDTYAFYNVPEFTFNYLGTDDAKTLNLRKNYGDADVDVSAMTGIETGVATITKASAGAYTVVPVAPGTYTVKYENTSATIVVNQYTLTPSTASIAKSTGSTVLTLKKNNGETKTINASTAKVEVKRGGSTVTSGFSLTTNGSALKFGNVTTAGTYTFEYTEDSKVVAVATVTVTE